MKNVYQPLIRIVLLSFLLGFSACGETEETVICGEYSYDGRTEIFETAHAYYKITQYAPSGNEKRSFSISLRPPQPERNPSRPFSILGYPDQNHTYFISFQIDENLIGVQDLKIGGMTGVCYFSCSLPTVAISCFPYDDNYSIDITEYGFVTIDQRGAEYRVDFHLTIFGKEFKGWYQGIPQKGKDSIAIVSDPS